MSLIPGPLGMGGAPLGNLFARIPEDVATATVQAGWDAGIRHFDTAPHYGAGLSELRLGAILRQQNRDDYTISSKIGRRLVPAANVSDPDENFYGALPFRRIVDYSAGGTTRSIEDSLARMGILFNHLYAAGDRSQKGLVTLLSGYPNQPTTSIIKFPRKTQRLPHLCRTLAAAGYHSSYYYGGELAFANMKSYLQTAGYERLTERSDFAATQQNSKWGAHDGVLFTRMLADLAQQPQPFFMTAFTLSSHEPFDVPMKTKFPGASETAKFRNSVFYTDYALGQFLREAKKQPWYAHTLLVLVADHGHMLPGPSSNQSPHKFQIPLLLAGGAVRPASRGRVISTIGSQTDVAATLLAQLRLPATGFVWSRNLLAAHPVPFAFYCFNDGFGAVSPDGAVTYDNVSRQAWERDGPVRDAQVKMGQALEQVSMDDFTRR